MARKHLPLRIVHGGEVLRLARTYAGVAAPEMEQRLGLARPDGGGMRAGQKTYFIERSPNPEWFTFLRYAEALGLTVAEIVAFWDAAPLKKRRKTGSK